MSTAAITFEEIERSADRTAGYALLARATRNMALGMLRTYEVLRGLDKLFKLITPELSEQLDETQLRRLTTQLQDVYKPLVALVRARETERLKTTVGLGALISRLQDRAEDFSDLIENLALTIDPGFKQLVNSCTASVGR